MLDRRSVIINVERPLRRAIIRRSQRLVMLLVHFVFVIPYRTVLFIGPVLSIWTLYDSYNIYWIIFFLAPTGAQEVAISVCLSVCLSVPSAESCLDHSIFIFLAQFLHDFIMTSGRLLEDFERLWEDLRKTSGRLQTLAQFLHDFLMTSGRLWEDFERFWDDFWMTSGWLREH